MGIKSTSDQVTPDLARLPPEIAATGQGPPMRGRKLAQGLERLVTEFDAIAVPDQGRYVPSVGRTRIRMTPTPGRDNVNIDHFREMYQAELQEARSVEAQLTQGLPKMAEAAENAELREAFQMHLEETRGHQRSVEALLRELGASPREHEDQALRALITEAEKMMGMVEAGPLRDAALIASAQRIEHYEIAVYGTLATYAKCLGLDDHKQKLADILEDEKATDERLSELADGIINPAAVEAG